MASPNDFKEGLMEAQFDLGNDTIRVLLLDDSTAYTFDPDAHEFVADILAVANEMSGTGYTRKTLGSKQVTEDTTDDEGVFDGGDITWSGINAGTIQTVVVYKQVGGDDNTPGDDPVIVVLDDDSAGSLSTLPLPTNGTDVVLQWATEGIINTT